MSEFLIYLLKSGICMALFISLYFFFLRKETFFQLNRFYLILALIGSLFIPAGQLTVPGFTGLLRQIPLISKMWSYSAAGETGALVLDGSGGSAVFQWDLLTIIFVIYWTGVVFLVAKFFYNLFRIFHLIRKYGIEKAPGYRIVWMNETLSPFSFMNIVFMNREHLIKKSFQKIIAHELVHIYQWHTLDLIFSELVLIFQWINPFVWPYKRYLKETHEYLADAGVIAQGCDATAYQVLIVEQIVGGRLFGFSSSFHHTQIKRRIQMMLQHPSKKRNKMKLLLIFPVILMVMIFYTSIGQLIAGEDSTKTEKTEKIVEKKAEVKEETEAVDETSVYKKKMAKLEWHLQKLKSELTDLEIAKKEIWKKKEALIEAGESVEKVDMKMKKIKFRIAEIKEEGGKVKNKMKALKAESEG